MDTDSLRSLIAKRLRRICSEEFQGTKAKMARELGVSQSKMSRILNEKQNGIDAYLEVASQVASTLDIPLEQITEPSPPPMQSNGENEVVRYYDVEAGAGDGLQPMNEWDFVELTIPRRLLRALVKGGTVPSDVGILRVRGQSMYPEITSGDYVLWTPCETIADGGTYVIRLDDGIQLKMVQRKAGQRLRIHSLNSEFEDDFIRKCDNGLWVTDDDAEIVVDFDVIGEYLSVIQEKNLFRSAQRVHDAVKAYHSIEMNSPQPA